MTHLTALVSQEVYGGSWFSGLGLGRSVCLVAMLPVVCLGPSGWLVTPRMLAPLCTVDPVGPWGPMYLTLEYRRRSAKRNVAVGTG